MCISGHGLPVRAGIPVRYTVGMKAHTFAGLCAAAALIVLSLPQAAGASEEGLYVAGWIPYWRVSEGIKDAKSHLRDLDAVYPFGFTVKEDGSLQDQLKLGKSAWKKFIKSAKSKDVDVIPTVMWSDGAGMHAVLSDERLRAEHVEEIAEMVRKGKYAGVDIDYEGKLAATREYFSLFLEELKDELGAKTLACTIEARTPPDSLYATVPASIEYSNDYREINEHCDLVQIMAYDQGRADWKLNSAKRGAPYIPVSDVDWVRKVIELALKDIDRDKIVLGVPTYGYEYEVTVSPNWFQGYRKLWSLSENYAVDTADDNDIEPGRNKGGEMSYSYLPKGSSLKLKSLPRAPKGTPEHDEVAQRALAYANETGKTVTFNYVVWSDAGAVEQKAALARELGLKGVAIFKIDGGEDQGIWDALQD